MNGPPSLFSPRRSINPAVVERLASPAREHQFTGSLCGVNEVRLGWQNTPIRVDDNLIPVTIGQPAIGLLSCVEANSSGQSL